jgi:beclin
LNNNRPPSSSLLSRAMQSNLYLLQREKEFIVSGEQSFQNYIQTLRVNNGKEVAHPDDASGMDSVDADITETEHQLAAVAERRNNLLTRRMILSSELQRNRVVADALKSRVNQLGDVYAQMTDQMASIDEESDRTIAHLNRYSQMNAVNDAFYIWYAGPYGTINTFRLGNLSSKPIEFTEINAALGQAALVVCVVAAKAGIEFKSHTIIPFGSFPKIVTTDDRRTQYPLFIDTSTFNLFPKRNFNAALAGFLCCIQDLSDYISNYDPTLAIPYKITVADSKIGDLSCVYGNGDDEVWTRSLKFILSDIKWIVAWYTKHCNNYVPIRDI